MKAVTYTRYGDPEKVIKIVDIPLPIPGKGEVLLEMKAASINDYDWCAVRGKPSIYRLLFGLLKPKHLILGMEGSGVVVEVGEEVTRFKVGDKVYGDFSEHGFGSLAEYLTISEKALSAMPEKISFIEAASLPHAGLLALQGLVELGKIKMGERVLINGAGGGVGTLALAFAKEYQTDITGVDTGEKIESMQALGYNHVIDYKKTDFTTTGPYDLVLDTKTSRPFYSIGAYLKCLSAGGRYITVGGHLPSLLTLLFISPFISWFTSKKIAILPLKPNHGNEIINQWYQDGKLKFLIDGPYPPEKTAWALKRFGEAQHVGKVIIDWS